MSGSDFKDEDEKQRAQRQARLDAEAKLQDERRKIVEEAARQEQGRMGRGDQG